MSTFVRLTLFIFAMAAGLAAAPIARADAIPPLKQLNQFQIQLVGVWQEEGWTGSRWGVGHTQMRRTLMIGNENLTLATISGILPSNEFGTRAVSGSWTAKNTGPKTLVIKLDQGAGRGTDLTLVFDGPDAFTLLDAEASYAGPSRFVRQGKSPVTIR